MKVYIITAVSEDESKNAREVREDALSVGSVYSSFEKARQAAEDDFIDELAEINESEMPGVREVEFQWDENTTAADEEHEWECEVEELGQTVRISERVIQ